MFSEEFDPDVQYCFNKYILSIQGEEGFLGIWGFVWFWLFGFVGIFWFFGFFLNILVNFEAAKFLLCKTPGKVYSISAGIHVALGFLDCIVLQAPKIGLFGKLQASHLFVWKSYKMEEAGFSLSC